MGEVEKDVIVEQPTEQDTDKPTEQTIEEVAEQTAELSKEIAEQSTEIVKLDAQEAKIIESIESLPEEAKARVVTSLMVHREFSGPLPPASDFALYEKVLPGAGDRILKMAENGNNCRIEVAKSTTDINKNLVSHSNKLDTLGLWLGFIIGVISLGGMITLGILGHDKLAGTIMITTGALVGIFVLRKKPKESKQDTKE